MSNQSRSVRSRSVEGAPLRTRFLKVRCFDVKNATRPSSTRVAKKGFDPARRERSLSLGSCHFPGYSRVSPGGKHARLAMSSHVASPPPASPANATKPLPESRRRERARVEEIIRLRSSAGVGRERRGAHAREDAVLGRDVGNAVAFDDVEAALALRPRGQRRSLFPNPKTRNTANACLVCTRQRAITPLLAKRQGKPNQPNARSASFPDPFTMNTPPFSTNERRASTRLPEAPTRRHPSPSNRSNDCSEFGSE
jgi:hypothetical protein